MDFGWKSGPGIFLTRVSSSPNCQIWLSEKKSYGGVHFMKLDRLRSIITIFESTMPHKNNRIQKTTEKFRKIKKSWCCKSGKTRFGSGVLRNFKFKYTNFVETKNRRSWWYQFFETKPMAVTEKNYELNFRKNGMDFLKIRSCQFVVTSNIFIEFSNLSTRKKSYGVVHFTILDRL